MEKYKVKVEEIKGKGWRYTLYKVRVEEIKGKGWRNTG